MTPTWNSFSQEHKVLKMCSVQNGEADSLSIRVINVYFWRTTGEIYSPRAAVCMFLNSLTQTRSPITGGDVDSAPKISVHFPVQPPLQENNRHVQDPWDF